MTTTDAPAPRMQNPAMILPDAMPAIQALNHAAHNGAAPDALLELVHLRVSQINGCSLCVRLGVVQLRRLNESDDRMMALSAWRESPYFTDAERAALALAEAATRLSDRPDPVPDEVWDAAAEHHDEKALASIVLTIATTNLFNRLNAVTRQPADAWG